MALNAGPENLLSTQQGVGLPVEKPAPRQPDFPWVNIPFDVFAVRADKPAPKPDAPPPAGG
jgi:hypothetical protein